MTCRSLSAGRSRSRTGSVVRGARRFALPILPLLLAGLFAAAPATGTGPIDEKKAEAQQVYDEILQLDQSLGVADEKINLANLRLRQVAYQQRVNRRELTVARANLKQARHEIVARLRALYDEPQTSSLDLILGATSLSDLLNRIDDSNRLTAQDTRVVHEVLEFRGAVVRHSKLLAHDRSYAQSLLAERRSERAEVADKLSEQQSLYSQVQGQIKTLEAQEAARQLQMVKAAQQQIAAAEQQQQVAAQQTVVGATVSVPEGSGVLPTSPYGSQVVQIAMSYIGTPYVWGGAAPGGFDCSGLVMYSFAQLGVSLPHSSYAQWNYGISVPYDDLEPGDILFFDGLGHVGLYIGGGEYVDAPYTGVDVRVDSLDDGWSAANYVGARRIL